MISVGSKFIGPEHPPFIIAEMSGNHNQSLDRAMKIVEEAAKAGVHALKLQTYTADTMTIDLAEREFFINDPNSLWKGKSLYELYKEAHTPWEWHEKIFRRCQELGMICFSTPFDATAVDFLERLKAPLYKIASFENTDVRLIKKVASTGKPIIISTGMADISEIQDAVDAVKAGGGKDLVLLKCTSSYPADERESHLRTIPHLREKFGTQVGLSDHTLGIGAAVASVAMGATVIEKHFTLSRAEGGVDAAFSLEPQEMKALVQETERAWKALGTVHYGISEKEKASRVFRRSLYVVKDMKKGDVFTEENIRSIRPGYGLPVKYFEEFLGKRASRDIPRGTPLTRELKG